MWDIYVLKADPTDGFGGFMDYIAATPRVSGNGTHNRLNSGYDNMTEQQKRVFVQKFGRAVNR